MDIGRVDIMVIGIVCFLIISRVTEPKPHDALVARRELACFPLDPDVSYVYFLGSFFNGWNLVFLGTE